MEAALNLCWIVVVGLLCGSCVVAHRRERLRVGLGTALACSLLLAAVLFPAISMTDDLQTVNLQAEIGLRSVAELMHAALLAPAVLSGAAAVAMLLAFALWVLALAWLSLFRRRSGRLPAGILRYRPVAVRPPTASAIA